MNRWEEFLRKHPIFETFDQLEAWILTGLDEASPEAQVEVQRFTKVLNAFRQNLAEVDADLISLFDLNNLNKAIKDPKENIWSELETYSQDREAKRLTVANDHLTKFLGQLSQIIATARKSRIDAPLKPLQDAVEKQFRKIAALQSTLDGTGADFSTELNKLRKEADEIGQRVSSQGEEIRSLLTKWQEQFANAQEARNKEFGTLRDKLADDVRESVSEITERADTQLTQHLSDFSGWMKSIQSDSADKHARILELYEIVAGDSVTG